MRRSVHFRLGVELVRLSPNRGVEFLDRPTGPCSPSTIKVLRRASRPYRKVYVHPTNHAGYYPGAEAMTIKLLFDPETGRVLGAQAVGGAGVDKRIDVLAMAIQAGMTVFNLEESELAYSPQYGSAKDPINMAGFVAAGLLRGDHPQVDVEIVLNDATEQRPFLVNVRTPQEFSRGHIPGAVNIPLDELRSRLASQAWKRKAGESGTGTILTRWGVLDYGSAMPRTARALLVEWFFTS